MKELTKEEAKKIAPEIINHLLEIQKICNEYGRYPSLMVADFFVEVWFHDEDNEIEYNYLQNTKSYRVGELVDGVEERNRLLKELGLGET